MKINLLDVPKDYEGKDIVDSKKKTLTYRDIFSTALNSQLANEIMGAEEKAKIFQLSLKLYKDNEVDLTLDEKVLIKTRASKIWNPLVYGRICEILEEVN